MDKIKELTKLDEIKAFSAHCRAVSINHKSGQVEDDTKLLSS